MMPRDRSFGQLLLCFFLSGLAALIYETAWTREFAFVFGTSELAVSTVLAAYMGGLAAGAALAGRYANRVVRPVLVYGVLELGIAVSALAVPYAIAASRWLYVRLFAGGDLLAEAGGLTTAIFYLICSFAILLIPTAMMGATLPLLARHAVREDRQLGRRVGTLYAVNTAGAIAGTVLAAFVLLPSIGLRATIAAAAGANALVFLAAWSLARGASPLPAAPPRAEAATASRRARWILPLIAASGFTSFAYEVLWVRLLGHMVGVGVIAFATMLASFLAGIALGSAIAARFASTRRSAALGFALAQLGVAASSLLAFAIADRVPDLRDTLGRYGVPVLSLWSNVPLCMMTLLPPTLLIGATFPFAVRVLAGSSEEAGPASARVYSANTLGSIAGAIGAGFFLIPALGFEGMLGLGVAINLLLAAMAALLLEPRRPWLLAAAAAGAIALALVPPTTPWRMLRSSSLTSRSRAWGELVYFGVGRSSTVLVTDQHLSYGLRNNGLPEAGIETPGIWHNRHPLTRWLTALPVLARPEARSLVLVGLGGGVALEVVPPTIERIDVIELEAEVLAANRALAALRWRDPLSDPRLHVHLNDARNALLLSKERFDIVVSQPSHPWAGGAAHLYTLEYFDLVARRLSDDGVFVQWIGLPFVDEAMFRSLLATLAAVFPHLQVYTPPPTGSALFLASKAPLEMEASIERALAAAPESFALLGINRPEDVFASLLLDDAGARELAAGAPLNRDRHNRLEIRSSELGPTAMRVTESVFGPVDPLVRALPKGLDVFYLLRRLDPGRVLRVARSLEDPIDRAVGEGLAGIAEGKRVAPRRRLEQVLAGSPRHVEARAALLRLSSNSISRGTPPEEILAPPLLHEERLLAEAWAARARDSSGKKLRALDPELATIPLSHPLGEDAARLRILARISSGDPELVREAMQLADAALSDRPDPRSLLLRAEAYAAAGEHGAVLETAIELVPHLDPGDSVNRAILRRARALIAATPADDEDLRWLRRSAQRALGLDGG